MNLLDALLGVFGVQANGTPLARRQTINFSGLTVADDPVNNRTNVAAGSGGAEVFIAYVTTPGGINAFSTTGVAIPELEIDTAAAEKWIIQWVLKVGFPNPSGVRVQVAWPYSPDVAEARALFVSDNGTTTITPAIQHACASAVPFQDLIFLPPSETEGFLTIDLMLKNGAGSGKAKVMFGTGTGTGPTSVARGSYVRAYKG